MPVAASLRALLVGAIDYAGLFPPATLELDPALTNYGRYLRDPEQWMLGGFVLPVSQLDDVKSKLAPFDVEHRLRISSLGPKTETPAEFIGAIGRASEAIRNFDAGHGATASTTQIEMALPARSGATISEAAAALDGVQVPTFWEAPPDDAERVIGVLAEHRDAAAGRRFGYKLRTGGVVPTAFPSSMQIARALVTATKQRVPIKFTAGLHHPVKQFHASVQTKMHGFLNVLGAGVMAVEHGWDFVQTAAMLNDEDSTSFTFDEYFFCWREWKVGTERIRAHREIITSFGSCSFDEPRDDLRSLDLL